MGGEETEDVTQMQCDKGHKEVPWETRTGVPNLIQGKLEWGQDQTYNSGRRSQ